MYGVTDLPSGSIVDGIALRKSDGLAAQQLPTHESLAYDPDRRSDFAIAMEETPAGSGIWPLELPAWMAGQTWEITYYRRIGDAEPYEYLEAGAETVTIFAAAATGILTAPMERLRELVAQCAAWQDWIAPDTPAAAAIDRIHLVAPTSPAGKAYSTAELEDLRPFAVVFPGPQFAFTKFAAGPAYRGSGELLMRIEANVPEQYQESERDAELEFCGRLGTLIQEMGEMDEGLGYLVPLQIRLDGQVQRASRHGRSSEGDYFTAALAVSWDGGGA